MELTHRMYRGPGLISRVIGYFGAGYYSHIDVRTPQGYYRGAFENERTVRGIWYPPGYEDRPEAYYGPALRVTDYTIDVSVGQWEEYWRASNAKLHKPYDYRGLWETFVEGRQWRDNDSWWCSEAVADNLEQGYIITDLPSVMKAVEPGDCVFMFCARGARIEEIWPKPAAA